MADKSVGGGKKAGSKSGGAHRVMVPKFLLKTYDMLETSKYHKYVSWNDQGDALIVKQQHGFTDVVLPAFFKHSNFASFVRQLNMYGFRRVDDKIITFQHSLFKKGNKESLALIKRKVANKDNNENGPQEIQQLLKEMKDLKAVQKRYNDEVSQLKSRNEHLESENSMMWEALGRAKQRQDLLASKMQKIMMFLYEAYRKPQGALGNSSRVHMIADGNASSSSPVVSSPGESADVMDRAYSLMDRLHSSDNYLSKIDKNGSKNVQEVGLKSKDGVKEEVEFGKPFNTGDLERDHSLAMPKSADKSALSLEPSLSEAFSSGSDKGKEEYIGLAKKMDEHLANQNNTLHRLNTVESMMEDPLDSFLDYTSPEQISSLLDLDDDKTEAILKDSGASSPRKKRKLN